MAEVRAKSAGQGRLQRLDVDKVKVGHRSRSDLGDLASLVESIKRRGLLHPIVVDSKHQLVVGGRRLAAWKEARPGEPIPAIVAAHLDERTRALLAERDENEQRKPLTPSEAVAFGEILAKIERPKAQARQGSRTDLPAGKLPTSSGEAGRTRDVVAAAVEMSGRTYEKAKEVVEATHDPKPAVKRAARKAVKQMDATGKVDPAHIAVRDAKQAAEPVDVDRIAFRTTVSKLEKQAFVKGLFALEPSAVKAALKPSEIDVWKARAREAQDWFDILLA